MPFYKIFSKQPEKARQIPKIIADIHEKNSLVLAELESNKQVQLQIKSLKIADYIIGNTAIERKTVQDFISSMINKRLIQQLKQMQKYKQSILIIEGNTEKFNDFKNPNAIRGFILSILLNNKVPIIMTKNYEDTAKYLITLAKQQMKKPIESTLHSKIPKTLKEQKQYILESFPNIGPIKAKQLLKKFKTISETLNAEEQELKQILKNRTENFKKILHS